MLPAPPGNRWADKGVAPLYIRQSATSHRQLREFTLLLRGSACSHSLVDLGRLSCADTGQVRIVVVAEDL